MNTLNQDQKPGLLLAIAWMTLASGVVNLFWGFVASATALGTIIGVICLPLTILPTILGVFEIVYAAKLLSAQPEPVQPSTSIAVFEILMTFYGNAFSVVVGILALIFYNDQSVKEYFARTNGVRIVAPIPAPASPAPVPLPGPAPSLPVVPEPEAEAEKPQKPKRVRKVAGK